MPPKRTSTATKTARAAAAAPMTDAAVKQLECPYLVELSQEGSYTRGCLYHGLEGIEEVDDGQILPKG
ncbi:hypothetical protein Tco_0102340 [Tanacetum coccineum]